jgi:hypothetical protein
MIISILSINTLDQKLISVHQQFLFCTLNIPEMSPEETMHILKSIRSSDYVYDETLKEIRGNFSDPLIKHLFGGPFRISFRSNLVSTSIAYEGSTWIPVNCQKSK